MSSQSKIIFIGAGVTLAALAAYYFYSRSSSSPPAALDKPLPQQPQNVSEQTILSKKPSYETLKEYKNEKFGIKFNYSGNVVVEKADLFPLIKICSDTGESFTHFIIQPHDGSSVESFIGKAFAEVNDRLKIDVKTISTKKIKLQNNVDALEIEYQYVYPAPLNKVISYWSIVTAANGNIYFFQHFSPEMKGLNEAKQIGATLEVFESKANGSLLVQVQNLEFELPSILYKAEKSSSLLDLVLKNDGQSVARRIRVDRIDKLSASMSECIEQYKKAKIGEKLRSVPITFANAITGEAFSYSNKNGFFFDVCLIAAKVGYVISGFCADKSGTAEDFQASLIRSISNTRILQGVNQESAAFCYVNYGTGFKIRFPVENLSLFTEHVDDDPVVTFIYSDLCETNISCITPDVPATSIEQVKREILKGLEQDEDGSTVKVLECNSLKIGSSDAVQFIYLQQMLYSQVTFKWMLTSILHQGKVYYIRSYAYEDAWKSDLIALFNSLVNNFEVISFAK